MNFELIKRSRPILHTIICVPFYVKCFSSLPSISSLSDVETQLRLLCQEPNFQSTRAVSLFHQAIDSYLYPSESICNSLLHNLVRSKNYQLTLSVYSKMTHVGIMSNFFSLSHLVDCFVHTHMLKFAFGVLGLILKRGFVVNVYVMNSMLKGLCSNGEVYEAMNLLNELKMTHVMPDDVTFTIIIKGLCKAKQFEDAMKLLIEMEEMNCEPDAFTYSILMDGLCKAGRVDVAIGLWEKMKRKGSEVDVVVYGTLVNAYCKMGQWKEATAMFNAMMESGIRPDAYLYTCLISGLCKDGKTTKAIDLFN
eukprot:XP_025014357.1 pentatricopeptide repeat-containing protein At4g28010-like [Ricinus communis]